MKRRLGWMLAAGLMVGALCAAGEEPGVLPRAKIPELPGVPEVRPVVVPSLAVVREPEAWVDVEAFTSIETGALSDDGGVLWLAGEVLVGEMAELVEAGPVDVRAMKRTTYRNDYALRVVGLDTAALAVTRELTELDPAYQWRVDRRGDGNEAGPGLIAEGDLALWMTGVRWLEPQRDEHGRFKQRPEQKRFVARWDADGLAPGQVWIEGDIGYALGSQTVQRLARRAVRVEIQRRPDGEMWRDEDGWLLWLYHWIDTESGEVVGRYVDDTARQGRGFGRTVSVGIGPFTRDGRYALAMCGDDRFGRDRYWFRYDRELDVWSWPRRTMTSQGTTVTVMSADGSTVATVAGSQQRPNRVFLTRLRDDERYDPQLAERIAAAFAPAGGDGRVLDPENDLRPDWVEALEPAKRVTLPDPPEIGDDAKPDADRRIELPLSASDVTDLWAFALSAEGDRAYVGVGYRRQLDEDGERRTVFRLLSVDVDDGGVVWDVALPTFEAFADRSRMGFPQRLTLTRDGEPVVFSAVSVPAGEGGLRFWAHTSTKRIDVHRLDPATGEVVLSREGQPGANTNPLPSMSHPDADLLVSVQSGGPLHYGYGHMLSREVWRLERWDGDALTPTTLVEEVFTGFEDGAWVRWRPRFGNQHWSDDGSTADFWMFVGGRGRDANVSAAWRNTHAPRWQRYAVGDAEGRHSRPVGSPVSFPPFLRWHPLGTANPDRLKVVDDENVRMRVLRHTGVGPSGWACDLAFDLNGWQDWSFNGAMLEDPSRFAWFGHRNASPGIWLLRVDLATGDVVGPRLVDPSSAFGVGVSTQSANAAGTRVVSLSRPGVAWRRSEPADDAEVPSILVFDLPPVEAIQEP
ncbi:MAG: hypothetical protein AAGF84_06385 [Planctomycetota bacterium]